MHGAVCLVAEVDPQRIERRLKTRYLDKMTDRLDQSIEWALDAKRKRQTVSIAIVANAADLLAELVRRNVTPDVLTDQTSAHDPLNGYVPNEVLGSVGKPVRSGQGPTRPHSHGGEPWSDATRRCCDARGTGDILARVVSHDERARPHMISYKTAGRSRLTMAIIFAARRWKPMSAIKRNGRLGFSRSKPCAFRGLYRNTSGRSFARGRGRFDGRRYPGTRRTSRRRTRQF